MISKASALSLATPHRPTGRSAPVLFTEPGRGEGRRNAPMLPLAGRSRPHPYGVSTCSRARTATYGTGRDPRPQSQATWQRAPLQYCLVLQFPRTEQKLGWEIKAAPFGPAGSGEERQVRVALSGQIERESASQRYTPRGGGKLDIPAATTQQHPRGPHSPRRPGRPGCPPRPAPPPGEKIGGDQ